MAAEREKRKVNKCSIMPFLFFGSSVHLLFSFIRAAINAWLNRLLKENQRKNENFQSKIEEKRFHLVFFDLFFHKRQDCMPGIACGRLRSYERKKKVIEHVFFKKMPFRHSIKPFFFSFLSSSTGHFLMKETIVWWKRTLVLKD